MAAKQSSAPPRVALALLLLWAAPAAALCELDCAPLLAQAATDADGHAYAHAHAAAARSNHDHAAPAPHGHASAGAHDRSERGTTCCCSAESLLARVADAQELDGGGSVVAYLAAASASRPALPAPRAGIPAKAPPGPLLGRTALARNLPLLL